jgi:hypothetical protein
MVAVEVTPVPAPVTVTVHVFAVAPAFAAKVRATTNLYCLVAPGSPVTLMPESAVPLLPVSVASASIHRTVPIVTASPPAEFVENERVEELE